jgi:hypothetical protein
MQKKKLPEFPFQHKQLNTKVLSLDCHLVHFGGLKLMMMVYNMGLCDPVPINNVSFIGKISPNFDLQNTISTYTKDFL